MNTIVTTGKRIVLPLLLIILAIASCTKDEDDTTTLPRLFRPGAIKITTADTQVKLEWNASLFTTPKAVKYTVEVYKDPAFTGTPDFTGVTDTSGLVITDAKLSIKQKYYARVKANATDVSAESAWVASADFTIPGIQLFSAVLASEIIDGAAILRWKVTPGITRLVLTPQPGTAKDIALVAADIAAGRKLVDNLVPNTTYIAELFIGTKTQGTVTFKTKVSTISGNIVDLRAITNRPNVLADTLPKIPSGSTVILKRGLTYNIPVAQNLDRTVVIQSGDDLLTPTMATISMVSNFNISASSSIDSIVFRNVTLRSDGYASKYVFNVSNACTVGKLSFQSCNAAVFRGIVRLQTAVINMTDFVVNNCIVDSLSNYGLITVDNVNCKVNNFVLTNSTFYKCEKIITSRQNAVTVNIANCTFNETPWGNGANYLVDFSTSGTNNVTGGIKISNSIMGPGWLNAGSTVVRGLRYGTAVVDVTGTYNTSDYSATANTIPNMTLYNKLSTELFTDPANGNFKIKDTAFPGKSSTGDPRWRL
ncbi:DUF5123 domain-containing protein [Hufsiella ginkgonis]|uniref:DUF5123 domain-containing protein n=1 Tax=Hufsiella ginkgonis TaxID=2695274 RepID=A0A7K1XUJ8_9SPHI|nr:DUF5123 domain-containing protein [Hufsiella ginkgonis]MXV14477.1 DUF5123 domain-containing protein [Hufsiella ginkgonis]